MLLSMKNAEKNIFYSGVSGQIKLVVPSGRLFVAVDIVRSDFILP